MTQNNIDTMNIIVDLMKHGTSISTALKRVYSKRNFAIPYNDEMLNVDVRKIGMTARTTNALMREHLYTINDIVKYCQDDKITTIKNLGRSSGVEIFEKILDYCWGHMNNDERTNFLIDTVERNETFIRI